MQCWFSSVTEANNYMANLMATDQAIHVANTQSEPLIYGPNHPYVRGLEQRILDLEKQLEEQRKIYE